MRVVELIAPGAAMVEGLEYAKDGQTKKITTSPGRVEGLIQGRADRPYVTIIEVDKLSESAWERVVPAMSEGAIYSAKLLAGELPTNIEDLFGPLDLRLFPADAGEVRVSCTCTDHAAAKAATLTTSTAPTTAGQTPDLRWCKHVCCLAYLLGQRLATEPFLMFALRGLDSKELLERLRERRAMAAPGLGDRSPIYVQHIPGVSEQPAPPLEASLANFWEAGPGLSEIDIPMGKPPVSHPLLRRLGPSPLAGTFPMMGLLASCYDVISDEAIRKSLPRENDAPPPEPPAGDAAGSDDDGLA
ncbi:hypothetical protein PHYC_02856 [Phycisphaerales bacterium]|nr:hypothetical protein PHYC_02856 [Phycisphaerales bacterium]